ncbi:MAG: cobalt-precorrin-7 (C5)-methyltransferase [Clostridia bacterium]|jgi:cobalt-precorrin-7 (C5)-methyltransferase|nr:precorrin-6Y C5,15-methyltransferase (decarboxylating) [Clostridiales bacterium]MDK2984854.1 cobalt-precorrin-7 (C5)-methyltransferase [Clostridia bacterium]
METTIAVIGTGPGHKDYITGAALKRLQEAQVVVGGKRLLEEFALPHQEQYPITKDLKGVLQYIKEQSKTKSVAVLVSGDTGIYSFSSYLTKNIPPERLEFYPGISSLQLMFARLKMSWQDACFLSFHGGPPGGVEKVILGGKTVGLLTDNHYTPQKIAEYLIERQVPESLKVAVGRNLSYEDERIFRGTLGELRNSQEDFRNSVVVIYHG